MDDDAPQVTLFMLVTERDCVFADYAVASFAKVYDRCQAPGSRFVLFVYLNCLSAASKARYAKRWAAYPYVTLFDNAERTAGRTLVPGEDIVSPEGIVRQRDDAAENYDELWTSRLPTFTTPIVGTVDADFEVLDPDFYVYLLDALASDDRLVGASTSYSPTSRQYDTYSKRHLLIHERNHTWFCLYRREAFQLSQTSHFYYEEANAQGETEAFDSAARFQHDLRLLGRTFATLPPAFSRSFIHYGAASKNKSITPRTVGFYRRVFLWTTVGVRYGSQVGLAGRALNRAVRRVAGVAFRGLLERVAAERRTYVYDETA